jgi:antitoxin component of MazEF toxin-antitoxin module
MSLEFERSCQNIGGSKGVIIPPEVLKAIDVDTGDIVVIRYYEKEKGEKIRKYLSLWKKGA